MGEVTLPASAMMPSHCVFGEDMSFSIILVLNCKKLSASRVLDGCLKQTVTSSCTAIMKPMASKNVWIY